MLISTFLTKSLNEYDRQRLCMTLLGLNVIQIFLAIVGFSLGAYISLDINSKAHVAKGYTLKPIGGTLSGSSIVLFLLHCLGAKASNDCGYLRTRHRFKNKLLLIVLAYVIMSATFVAISVVCMIQNYKLKQTLRHGLLQAMKFYSKDKTKKRELDEIQMEYRCCGSSNHTDWFKVKWMPEFSLPPENDKIFRRRDYRHSVPFSCCDPSSAVPCFHRLVSAERGKYSYPNHGFFKRGCTEVLLEVLKEVTQATALLMVVPLFIELTIAVQTRYLQTSLEDSERRKNVDGVGDCWLFKKSAYESHLQFKNFMPEDVQYSSSLSSEESVLFKPRRIKNSKNYVDEYLKGSPKTLKDRMAGETHMLSDDNEFEYEDLQTLLLKQMYKNGERSRSKSSSRLKHSPKTKDRKNVTKYEKSTRKQTKSRQVSKENDAHA